MENADGVSLHLFCACAVRLTSAICRLYHNGKLSSSRGLLLHVSVDFVPMLCLCVVLSAWLFSLPASWLYCVVRWPVVISVWAVVPNWILSLKLRFLCGFKVVSLAAALAKYLCPFSPWFSESLSLFFRVTFLAQPCTYSCGNYRDVRLGT